MNSFGSNENPKGLSESVKSLEEMFPVLGTCRKLELEMRNQLVSVFLFGVLPLLLLATVILVSFHGLDRWEYFAVCMGLGTAIGLFFLARYFGTRWALQNVCTRTTLHFISGDCYVPGPCYDYWA
jgi:positive regulator of sigma E activity